MGVSSSEDQRFERLWDDAVQQYFAITGKDLKDHSIPKPESVEELIESVTKQHAEFAAFRERGTKLRKCLKDALIPVKLVGNLAAGGASIAFPPSQCIFSAVIYLINAAENVGAYYDAIVALFSKVEDFTMRLKIYAEQEILEGLRAILTEILTTLLKLLALSAKQLYLGSRVRKYLEFTLLGRDDKIDDAIAQLDRLTRSEQLMTNAEILSQVTRTGKAIGRIEDAVNRHEASQATSLLREGEQKVKDTLRPEICTFDTFIEAKDELLKDSGQWIWHESVFLDWVDRKKPLLWIYGFPGSGKSFLSCSIIQSLERRFPQCVQDASRVSVAYFFCKDDNPKLKSINTLLRTVSYQITKNDPVYAKYVAGLCSLLEDGTSMATLWKRLFVEFFLEKESRSCVFLVIDGLDEAYEDERQIFFRLMKSIVKDHGTCRLNIQVLLVGRHHITEEIEEAFGVLPPRLEISASKNSKDIERYVRESVRNSVKLRRLPKSLRTEIVDTLSNGANGFFLWAKLMLKEVQSRYHHPSQIRTTLSNLPRGLTSTFQLVVDRFSKTLPDQDIDDLNHIIAWAICASRPLTLRELDQSLRIRPSSDQEVFDLESMIRRYGSFFSLTNYEGTSTEEGSKARSLTLDDELEMHDRDIVTDDIGNNKHDSSEDSLSDVESRHLEKETPTPPPRLLIRLSHASIGDFFRGNDQTPGAPVHFDCKKSETMILKICLEIFCDAALYEKCESDLAWYCGFYWDNHLQRVQISDVDAVEKCQIAELLIKMFWDEPTLARRVQHATSMLSEIFIYSDKLVATIHAWYKDRNIQEHIESDVDVKNWVDRALISPIEVQLRPVALACARQWLKCGNTSWCDEFEFLDGYLVRAQEPATKLTKGAFHIEKLPAERIIKLASWAGFEESAWWLSRVAYMLWQTGSIDESIAHYERAIALDPEDGIALEGLGIVYSIKGQYRKAIEITLRSQKFLASNSTDRREASSFNLHLYIRSRSFCQLAYYYEKLGEVDSAIENYEAAIEDLTQPQVGRYFADYLSLLLRHGKYQQALELVERVTSIKEMEMESDLWEYAKDDESYDGLNKAMSILALRTGHFEAIQAFYRKGLEASLRWSIDGVDSAFRFYYAMVLLHISLDETKAIRMLETVAEDPQIASNSKKFHVFKRRAEMELAKVSLKKCLEARSLQDSYKADYFGEKLLKFSKCESGSGNTQRPALIACVWHRLHFRKDTAKQCVKASVLLAIDLLTDDTDENDYEGWNNLADSLTAFGDLVNAIAALSASKEMLLGYSHAAKAEKGPDDRMKMCHTLEPARPHDESTILEPCDSSGNASNMTVRVEKPSVSAPDTDSDAAATAATSGNSNRSDEQQIGTDQGVKVDHDDIAPEDAVSDVDLFSYLCDGTCYKCIRVVEGHYKCTYCLEVELCEDCYRLLMSDKLGLNICGKDHEFLYVPPAEGLYEKGTIKVGGQFVKTQTWLGALKAEWVDNHS